jgi:hypothetical protein
MTAPANKKRPSGGVAKEGEREKERRKGRPR